MSVRPNPLTWLPLWERALEPDIEIGIAFKVSGITREHFRDTLYRARKESGNDELNKLIMFMPGGDHTDEIWICKKEVELDDASPQR